MVHRQADAASSANRCRGLPRHLHQPAESAGRRCGAEPALPLAGIKQLAERLGVTVREPEVSVRTGDTPQRERARFRRNTAEILITMPESLYLLLTSDAAVSVQAIYGSGRTDLSTKPPCTQAEIIA